MTLVVFILILSVLVLIHELGHFLAAKRVGIRVEEFGWGLPPRLLGKKIGETIYSINLLPFGGFVRLAGEDGAAGNVEDEEAILSTDNSRNFMSKTPWQRASVLAAGVTMNFLLGIALFYVFFFINGFKTYQIPLFFDQNFTFGTEHVINTVVGDIQAGSPAERAGLAPGEAIMSVGGVKVANVDDLRKQLVGKAGTSVDVLVEDLQNFSATPKMHTISVTPAVDPTSGDTIIGVYLTRSAILTYDKPLEKVFVGFLHSYNILSYSVTTFSKIVGLSIQTHDIAPVSQSVAGPVGIYQIVGGILKYGQGQAALVLMDFVAMMSLSLGFVNLLPFPALDGGRLIFVVVEGLRGGKRVNPRFEALVHRAGMAVLLALIVLITVKDIFK